MAKKSIIRRLTNSLKRTAVKAFDVGGYKRRLASIPSNTTAINVLIRRYGKNVVARSRYLSTNNSYAVAAKEAFVSALVGDGIKPSSLVADNPEFKAKLQESWMDWTDEADAEGVTDFYGMQAMVAAEMFEAGECFIRLRPRLPEDNLLVPLQLQLLPSEMLPLEKNETISGNPVEMGIEFDLIGRRVAYHFRRSHPGSDLIKDIGRGETVRVPAEEVIHLYRPVRVGQIRGIPHTLSGLVTCAMLDLYDDAELERKRTAALFAAFVTRPASENDDDHPLGVQNVGTVDPQSQFSMEPGAVVDLAPGEEVTFSSPTDVGSQYEAFQYRNLLRLACGFGVPYATFGDLRRANYGSIRAGLVEFRRRVQAIQNHVMIFQMCRPVWRRWMDDAAVVGGVLTVTAAEYLKNRRALQRVKWIPPRWDWIDPLKDRQAEKLAVDNGFKSRDDVIEAEGYDPEEVDERIAASQERAERLGLVLGGPDAQIEEEPPAEKPDEAEDDEEDDDE